MKALTLFSLLGALSLCAHPSHTLVKDEGASEVSAMVKSAGHNGLVYQIDRAWAKVSPDVAPVINASAIAEDKLGQLYVVTDHPNAAFLVFEKDGTFVRSFGKGLEGGHGLEFFEKDNEEFLIHVDCSWHFQAEGWKATRPGGGVTILKKDGIIVKKLPSPQELELEQAGKLFSPCDVAITPDGNILVVDGYASDFVYEYSSDGEYIRCWGGPKPGKPGHLKNAHGISMDLTDPENPLVWVSSRDENKIKAFTLDGKWVETIDLPGAYAGQLVIRDGKMYTAVCWSKKDGKGARLGKSGFILVLDAKTRKVISAPGGTKPVYKDGKLQPLNQGEKIFIHGHDLYVDSAGAIYVGEWNADRRYPIKLTPEL